MWNQQKRQDFPPKKALKRSRGRNFYSIIIKLGMFVDLSRSQILCKNQLCDIDKGNRTFLETKIVKHSRGRNFDLIVTKLGTWPNEATDFAMWSQVFPRKNFLSSLGAETLVQFSPNLVKWLK